MSNILIIDDSIDMQKVLYSNLTARKYKVSSALNSSEALDLLQKNRFDLIILDIRLPDQSGLKLLKQLKSKRQTKNTPVFMITASSTLEDEKTAQEHGADRYFTKPFRLGSFLKQVNQTLETKKRT
jgi:DNA-binding response OmpR family regulator